MTVLLGWPIYKMLAKILKDGVTLLVVENVAAHAETYWKVAEIEHTLQIAFCNFKWVIVQVH